LSKSIGATRPVKYSEASIRVLKGLEPVRQRPGMYTRTEHPLHIVLEVIDNAADEALGGFATTIAVTMAADGRIVVEDDGRGIPVGLHPDEGVPVVEIVFTRLHAGGKFDKGRGGAYNFSGGLHGVGVSVTNALSKSLDVIVWRDGGVHTIGFANGDVVTPLASRALERSDDRGVRSTGTRVTMKPDPKYFDAETIPFTDLQRLLRSKAVLLPGVTVTLTDARAAKTDKSKPPVVETWHYEHGLRGYLIDALSQATSSEPLIPLYEGRQHSSGGGVDGSGFAEGEGADWVVAWTEDGALLRESYVNLIPTPAGGTHEAGLREGLFDAVKSFIDLHGLLPKGVRLLPEDVFARVSFVLSAKVLDPQFQGQIKERLNSRDAVKLVSHYARPGLELWLNQHVDQGRKLADLVIRQAQTRQRSAQKVEKKKGSGVAVLPGKLTDCESTDIARNEVFLVEGDSAGGSAKMGRDKVFQAILPLRGKVLNAWETERDRLFANNEIHDIAVAIGVDPHGRDDTVDLSTLRYGKVCILSDADVDGSHIQVLLLTLFFKHFPKLVDGGHLYVARPPLFRVDIGARGKKPAQKLYALDDGELVAIEDKLTKEGVAAKSWSISRFKGLGEMSAEQLWETTMNPDTRRLSQVSLGTLDLAATVARMNMLMGKGEAAARRNWLEEHGNEAEADI
jgi:topoisomerase-4 subunit B